MDVKVRKQLTDIGGGHDEYKSEVTEDVHSIEIMVDGKLFSIYPSYVGGRLRLKPNGPSVDAEIRMDSDRWIEIAQDDRFTHDCFNMDKDDWIKEG
jgi:hypothetical protein